MVRISLLEGTHISFVLCKLECTGMKLSSKVESCHVCRCGFVVMVCFLDFRIELELGSEFSTNVEKCDLKLTENGV